MIETDEAALICDLAETYGIFDYRTLPMSTAAILAAGLRNNSRIKMKIAGLKHPPETMMLAAAIDRLSTLVWFQTKDGAKGRNRPASMVDALFKNEKRDARSFASGEEFEAARARILKGV